MLIIRDAQMEAFTKQQLLDFKRRVRAHLLRLWPLECTALGESALLGLIDDGIERARAYDMTTEQEALCFIDLMFLVGHDFDEGSRHTWARELLTNSTMAGEQRVDALYSAAERLLEGGAGNGGAP